MCYRYIAVTEGSLCIILATVREKRYYMRIKTLKTFLVF